MCMSFGERLRKLRGFKDWTQETLAARLDNTDKGTVGAWEANRHRPQPAKMQRLAEIFEVPIGVLTNLENPKICETVECQNPWRPEIEEPATPREAEPPLPAATSPSSRWPRWALAGVLVLVASGTAVSLVATNVVTSSGVEPDVERLYGALVREGGYIVLSNPTVYRYANSGDRPAPARHPQAAAVTVATAGNASRPLLRSAAQYTGVGEAVTAFHIQALLSHAPRPALEIAQSNAIEDVGRHMILLGGWGSNPISTEIIGTPDRQKAWEAFHRRLPLRVHDGIAYRVTAEGTETPACTPEYEIRNSDGELVPTLECALITKVREPFHDRLRLVVAGLNSQGTEAAGRLLTEDRTRLLAWLGNLEGGVPEAFQVLIRVPVDPRTARPGTNYQLIHAIKLD